MSKPITTIPGKASHDSGKRRPPGPHGLSLFACAYAVGNDPMNFAIDMWRRYGDVVGIPFLIWPGTLLFHPDHVRHVFQEHHQNYDKNGLVYNASKSLFGNGLFTNNGESWLRQRRLMQPAFHRQRLAAFGTLMADATLAMLERWQNRTDADAPLDVQTEMMRLTQRIVGLALFNIDLSSEVDVIGQAFTELIPLIAAYGTMPFPPLSVPTKRNRRIQANLHIVDEVVYSIIKTRQEHGDDEKAGDLLSMLLAVHDEETGEGMSEQQIRDEVITLLLAGYETTSIALTWTWYVLSQHPEVEQHLHAELEQVLNGHPPTVEQLTKLPYMQMVIQETMRLYSPAFGISRYTVADDSIGGYYIPAKSIVLVSPYCTHRHPDFWEQPEVFDPERFTPERAASRPRFAYFPFGGGPRQCIGNSFALMEAQIVLATVAQRYSLRLVQGHPVEPQSLIVVQPRYGLPMTVQER